MVANKSRGKILDFIYLLPVEASVRIFVVPELLRLSFQFGN